MVSFRHHLVSIIAIFLALAVGVALGAGPLRDGATDLMAGQNAEITAERDQLLADRDAATTEIAGRDSVIDAMASSLSDGVLVGVSVGLLTLPGSEGEDIDAVLAELTAAGASIAFETAVTEDWAAADLAFRQSYSGQVAGYLAERAPSDATPEYVLAAALAQVVTGGEDAATIGELLMAGDAPFVAEVPDVSAAVYVVVGPRVVSDAIDWAPVLSALGVSAPAVGIGDGVTVPARAAGSDASTVDSLPAPFAVDLLPLAVAAEIASDGGHWGVLEDATGLVPPRVIQTDPVEESAEEPAAVPESTTEGSDE